MIIAKPVIKEKFWILEEQGNRVGMMNLNGDNYVIKLKKKDIVLHSLDELKLHHIEFAGRDLSHGGQMTVMGYPTDQEDVFNIQKIDEYPCFTKKPNTKSIHAAGWYGVKFKNGWVQSFCPRLTTVTSYESVGPFKNQTDLRLILQQKRDARIIEDQ
jgi:hypothetical protein